eukprot:TRINITY_DN7936_c0_g1_i4.p1 TRINITY_DN7936_c0_g1~~TRINITY_DN7936_c0_g1_i4.p1  ORF type:complete len:146 (+),score=10.71 TRINITY_DN7936_c0_g1_i4:39-476(+)
MRAFHLALAFAVYVYCQEVEIKFFSGQSQCEQNLTNAQANITGAPNGTCITYVVNPTTIRSFSAISVDPPQNGTCSQTFNVSYWVNGNCDGEAFNDEDNLALRTCDGVFWINCTDDPVPMPNAASGNTIQLSFAFVFLLSAVSLV